MADIELRIGGDASGAKAALDDTSASANANAEEVGKAVVKWQALGAIMLKAAESAVRFGRDAVAAWASSERVQRQLDRAAGAYSKTLAAQADALSRKYAVDGDIIKQSQTLLTQWAGVGAATEDVTKAVLNYAAATGTDAKSATNDLIRQVETGGAGLRKLGIDFTATGDRAKDLASAVAALNDKFGGAAEAEAAGFTGRAAAASAAFDDLKKAIGEAAGQFLTDSGTFEAATKIMQGLADAISGKGREEGAIKAGIEREKEVYRLRLELAEKQRVLTDALGSEHAALIPAEVFDNFRREVADAQARLDNLLMGVAQQGLAGAAGTGVGVTGTTAAGKAINEAKEAEARRHAEEMRKIQEKNAGDMRAFQRQMDEEDDRAAAKAQQAFVDEINGEQYRFKQRMDLLKKHAEDHEKVRIDEEKKAADHAEKMHKEAMQLEKKRMDEIAEMRKEAEKKARHAADAIGAAFVSGLTDQLNKLAQGEELDPAEFIAEILAATISTAAAIIGSAYGMPALGAAVGNLAAMGIRAGGRAASGKARKTYHSGGWVEPDEMPRHHGGAWIQPGEQAAILQQGERVLSRAEVVGMGGPAAVETAARGRGGPSVVVNVSALDSRSAADSFSTDVGRGLWRAIRSGRGDVQRLFPAMAR